MSALPDGDLPADYKKTVADLIREVGLASMTPTILNRRLEAKYNISFVPHIAAVNEYVKEFMQTDEMRRELAIIQKAQEEGAAGGKGKKRGRTAASKGKKAKEEKVKKAKKPDDYPKAALSAYFFFAADFRAKHPELAMKDQMSKAGAEWREMTEDQKKPYEDKAAADKERHEKEMEAYLAKGGEVFKRGGKKDKKAKKDPNLPKRALSAYFFFAADFRAKHPELAMKDQMSKAGAEWREMTEDQKKPYEDKAAADKERYARECATKGVSSGSAKTKAKSDSKDAASSSSDSSSDDSSDSSSSDNDE